MKKGFIFRRYKKMENVKLKRTKIVSNIRPDWEELCNECSEMAKAVGWTKDDSRKLLMKVRNESRANRSY